MKFKLIGGLIFFGIVTVPMIGVNLYAIGAWETFTRPLAGLDPNAEANAPPEALGKVGKGVFDFVHDRREQSEKAAVFDVTTPTPHRAIVWNRYMEIEDVLAEGEPDPGKDLHELYILARAPALVMRECPSVISDLATACAVSKVEIDTDSKGRHELTMRIGFLPADPAGDISGISSATEERESIRLTPRDYSARVAEVDLPALRATFYSEAQRQCRELRDRVGSCVVRYITIDEQEDSTNPGSFTVSAYATLSWLKTDANADAEVAQAEPTGVSGFFKSVTNAIGGGSDDSSAPASTDAAAKPTVLKGGGAFRSAGGSNFKQVAND
ncbi:hypothetical protein [Pseudoruegeria sp. HB172150]|uniref:hypothetical protein n=1 Tax=Pseudoruegeria sp. HB172150 TaxID=2721164 RepID=UPI001554A34C|nr:hypothetical protein [Pseudoruegeria sp. HB172150]